MSANTRTRVNADIWVALTALAAGAFVLFSIPAQVPGETILAVTDMGSSAFFPALAGIFMFICGGGLFFTATAGQGVFMTTAVEPDDEPVSLTRTATVFVLFVVYLLALDTVGMMVSSIILIAVMAFILQYENKKHILISAVVFPALVYVLFEHLLKILLPHGVLF